MLPRIQQIGLHYRTDFIPSCLYIIFEVTVNTCTCTDVFTVIITKDQYIIARVHNKKSVQLPYGFYTHHLDKMTQTLSSEYAYQVLNMKMVSTPTIQIGCRSQISSEYAYQVLNMKPFQVLVYTSYKPGSLLLCFHSLPYSLLIAYVILSRWWVQKPYGSCTLLLL